MKENRISWSFLQMYCKNEKGEDFFVCLLLKLILTIRALQGPVGRNKSCYMCMNTSFWQCSPLCFLTPSHDLKARQ